jgi:hypothetical protein
MQLQWFYVHFMRFSMTFGSLTSLLGLIQLGA